MYIYMYIYVCLYVCIYWAYATYWVRTPYTSFTIYLRCQNTLRKFVVHASHVRMVVA